MFSLNSKWIGFFLCITVVSISMAQSNTWVKVSDFSGGKRERAVAFSIGEYGYVGTGTDTAEMVRKDFWKYNASTDSWTQVAELPGLARRDAVSFTLNNLGYVGTGISDDVSSLGVLLNDFWSYNPLLNHWDSVAPYPGNQMNGVYFATGFSVGGKGYVCGGKTGSSAYSSELWEYKPSIDTWIQRASFPTGIRYMLSSFAIGNFAYVGFGATQDVYKRDMFRYNPGNNTWTPMPDLPGNVRGEACTFVLQDKGYVCGGYDGGLLDDLWEFDPTDNSWEIRSYFGGSERRNAISFSLNNSFAVVGLGKGYTGKKESIYRYYPLSYLGNEEENISPFSVAPNPSTSEVKIQGPLDQIETLKCANLQGQVVFEWTPNQGPLILPNFEQGSYILNIKVLHQQEVFLHKFLIY